MGRMVNSALIIVKGLHPPWNQGEVVATRNFIRVLSRIYDEVLVLSLIDYARGFEGIWKPDSPNVRIVYVNGVQHLMNVCKLVQPPYDLHVANISLLDVPKCLVKKAEGVYLYLYALKNVRAFSTFFRTMGILLGSSIYRKLRIITPSPMVYKAACRLHSNVFYVPTPSEVPILPPRKDIDGVTILCLAHADYVRFPIDKVVPAIAMLAREGYGFRMKVVFSQQAFKDYRSILSLTRSILEKYGLSKIVTVTAKNLEEDDKQKLFTKSHVFLYPALRESAVDPPLTVLEAMSYGLCTIATKVQSIPYIVKHKERGILIPRPTPSSIYQALKLCLIDRALLTKCSYNAWLYAKQLHNESLIIKYLRKIVQQY